jgi:hypothetical protein
MHIIFYLRSKSNDQPSPKKPRIANGVEVTSVKFYDSTNGSRRHGYMNSRFQRRSDPENILIGNYIYFDNKII